MSLFRFATKKSKKTTKLKDYASWFEIPAINFSQAVNFYNHIYGIDMEIFTSSQHTMAFFPADGGVGGAVVSGPATNPLPTVKVVVKSGWVILA